MGVYLPKMDMPKDRPQLLWIYPSGKALTVQSDVDPWEELQAVPVPEHGRLCDLDALIKSLELELKRHNSKQFTANWNDACLCVIEAPVVIEAEEGE